MVYVRRIIASCFFVILRPSSIYVTPSICVFRCLRIHWLFSLHECIFRFGDPIFFSGCIKALEKQTDATKFILRFKICITVSLLYHFIRWWGFRARRMKPHEWSNLILARSPPPPVTRRHAGARRGEKNDEVAKAQQTHTATHRPHWPWRRGEINRTFCGGWKIVEAHKRQHSHSVLEKWADVWVFEVCDHIQVTQNGQSKEGFTFKLNICASWSIFLHFSAERRGPTQKRLMQQKN